MDQKSYGSFLPWTNSPELLVQARSAPDDRSGSVYLYDEKLKLAAEIAIVVQRPLLLRGEPGCGKSSFAAFVARNLGWRYYEWTMTGRTEARDLLWRFDALSRLRDAQVGEAVPAHRYVSPGVLWLAFNPGDAMRFTAQHRGGTHGLHNPWEEINTNRSSDSAVVLIDEIDKAQPDVPNDLLEVFGLNRFNVTDINHTVTRSASAPGNGAEKPSQILFILTTNEERELPPAFLRRCVTYTIQEPDSVDAQIARLAAIAELHIPTESRGLAFSSMATAVARKCCEMRQQARKIRRRPPSTA